MSPPSDISSVRPEPAIAQEYSHEERKLLLEAAHSAIVSVLEGGEISLTAPSRHLAEPRGVFTTLYLLGHLRGCVGYPSALLPLYQTVIETAQAAAFDDPRFIPVRLSEARDLKISLSVLSAVMAIRAEEVEVGKHGLIISDGIRRGLLLPQVPIEHGWDRVSFLEQTCRKAGLPLDAWKKGAAIEAFTAEVFGDEP
jgi:AmmeMemoRadiSam system protein A